MPVSESRAPHAPARWSIGGIFLEGLCARDFRLVAATLHQNVEMRALLPSGFSDWHGRSEAVSAFQSWFGSADQFEVVDATLGEVAGRLHLAWRARLRPAPFDRGAGWHVIEQHAFAEGVETIEALDLICSGFRADRSNE